MKYLKMNIDIKINIESKNFEIIILKIIFLLFYIIEGK